MNILALDSTTRAGSVALARDGFLLLERSGDAAMTHGERLPADIMRTLDEAGIAVADLDLLAVAAGPGSFTGLRVGIAAMQGLALARGLTIVPVPTLEALAYSGASVAVASAFSRKHLIAAWMDGQRGEVFAALYEDRPPDEEVPPDGGSHLTEIKPAIAAAPAAVLDGWALPADSSITFIGDGAVRYRALLAERFGARARVLDPPPLAATIARIAFASPHRAVAPHAIVPVYVRRPDAELARARRQGSAGGDRPVMERVTAGADLDAVAQLEAECFINPWTREMLERELQRSDVARVYVLRNPGGGVSAFCTCWVVVDELHINTLAVHPDQRRAGLATTLMRQVLAEAALSGAKRATLEVRASNEAARRLYATLGFREAGLRPLYYSKPEEDAIILWREFQEPESPPAAPP